MARIRITVAVEADRYSYRSPECERDVEFSTSLATSAIVMEAVGSVVKDLTRDVLTEYVAKEAEKARRAEDRAALAEADDTPMAIEDDLPAAEVA